MKKLVLPPLPKERSISVQKYQKTKKIIQLFKNEKGTISPVKERTFEQITQKAIQIKRLKNRNSDIPATALLDPFQKQNAI